MHGEKCHCSWRPLKAKKRKKKNEEAEVRKKRREGWVGGGLNREVTRRGRVALRKTRELKNESSNAKDQRGCGVAEYIHV